MVGSPIPRRFVAACLFLLAVWLAAPSSLRAEESPTPAQVRLDACGPMVIEPSKAADATGTLRPGQPLLSGDKGLGCRFTLLGKPGDALETVEVRLLRPGLVPGRQARDRWFVPVRRGTPATAAYAFDGPEAVKPGEWTLELYLADVLMAQKRFEVVAGDQVPATPAPAAVSETPTPAPAGPGARPRGESPAAATEAAKPTPAPVVAPAPVQAAAATPAATPPQRALPGPIKDKTPSAKAPAAAKETKPAGPVKNATPPRPTAATPFYALQTGLFANAANAAGQAAALRAHGLPACLATDGPVDKRRYRVLAGRFGDRRAALAARVEVEGLVGGRSLVVTVEPGVAAGLRCH